MGFAQCSWPIWRVDDLTLCFRQDYLKVLLPLAVIVVSFLRLAWSNIGRLVSSGKPKGYKPIANDHTALPPDIDDEDDDDDTEGDPYLEINGNRLALAKTISRGSVVEADTPHGQRLSQAVEELAIVGLIVVNAIALIKGAYGSAGRLVAITGLLTWIYVLVLASLRLLVGGTKWAIPHLWNHTASIYAINWVLNIFIFRSALINSTSQLVKILACTEFGLITLLFMLAATTRKGNKTVLMEWEDGIEPSREPLASLFSLATFAWVDAIVYKGWKKTMEIDDVWNLLPKDKAAAVIADYRQLKKTGALAWHMLKYFKGMLFFQCFLAFVSGFFTFAPTLLLRAILEYVEEPDRAPINVLWLYVIGLPILDTIRSYADGMALWTGRKICIRVRAIIIGDIYAKALRRKAAAGKDKVLGESSKKTKTDADPDSEGTIAKIKRALGLRKRNKNKNASASDTESAGSINVDDSKPAGDDDQANLGTIINLMSVDSFKIAEITAYLHFLCAAAPTQLIISVVLLWQVMGLSAIPGLVVMVFLLPVNYFLAKGFNITSKNIMKATDKRINVTNEVLQNIRIIKYFAWEERFGRSIDEKREAELNALRSRFTLWACAVAIWNSVPVLITFFSFLVYTLIEKKPLYPSIAFTAISLFMLLRVPLDQLGDMFAHVQEAKVSIDRVEEFLNEEETEKYEQLGQDNVDEQGVKHIGFKDATLIWGGKDTVAEDGSRAFRLMDLNVDFEMGKLNIIAGSTGSGKSSMLMGLLGEMTLMEGKIYCPGGRSREDVKPDPETRLADTVAYVAQSAWLVNANIRDNILFSAPYDPQRYRDVIVACALERDLEILDHGDETLVGEKGITLSGGQKQRISLARALYSNSAHVLMDDCLSAVDSHTAQWIFTNCIRGPLMANRTCILVTHNVALCVPSADYVVYLDNGRVISQGSAQKVNVAYYLSGLAIIGILGSFAAFVRDVWIFYGSLTASRKLHDRLMGAVTRAKFKFFDVTPLGQLMNRFSKDLEAVDQEIAATAIGVMSCALSLIVTVVLIAVITPGFLIAAVFIGGIFYFVATFYLRASRDLKRLESVQRSPLFQQFGETLSGMTTIRAYGDERRFIRDNLAKVNTQSRPFIYLWACNRWLSFRADLLGNLVSFSAGVFIILSLGKIDAGAAGISLSYAMNFTENVLWLVRLYGMNEQNMNSMERVKEYLDLDQEAAAVVEKNRPPESWPDKGNVEFVDYTTRYREDLDPVLKGITLKINAREKVGIVGRTGAGKSSLALAIFRALEAEKGRIVIDGINIGKIGLRDLRENITIVPQDPTLFMGTIQSNLDPFDQYTDEQVFEALRRVQLIGADEPATNPTTPTIQVAKDSQVTRSPVPSVMTNKNIFLDLSSPVTESGSNLSQGQRQLLCLARAMLKKPTVLVMDEATASIDYNTDSKIQETIRELTGTVITIAHRLQTIVDYDKVLVLDHGEVKQFGHPWELLSDEEGQFYSMCEMSGELDVLVKAAKRKWDEDRLVDVGDA
ncbi:ATP-dependent bile acid permease [Metarhizium anisopliae]|nr:ATP-dependent bile acid permease [Metarhizium anisopliae]